MLKTCRQLGDFRCQISLYFFLPAFVTKIGKKTLVSSNWNPPESFDIAQERPTSDRARSNEDVQNQTGVFKIARSCPNTDRRVRNCTIALEI